MATRNDRKRQSEQTSSIDDDTMVRGRAVEMEDRDSQSDEFDDLEDLNDEEEEEESNF